MKMGPRAQTQMLELSHTWKQGQHVLVTGGTGSGKTELARQLDEIRIRAGSYVVVFVCKLQPDDTIRNSYKGFKRWKRWKKRPTITENKILLWPAVEGLGQTQATALMREVFAEALEDISRTGRWTVHIDEGLFVTSPSYLNLGSTIGMMHALMRTSKATMITLAQRPAHLPLAIYANIDHAFIGQVKETSDMKRLADLGGNLTARELAALIRTNGKHDFTWVPIGSGKEPQRINLAE